MFELDTIQHRPNTHNNDESSHSSSSSSQNSSHDDYDETSEDQVIYLLGHRHDSTSLRDFQKRLYWMTYRRDFVGLRPYGGGGKFVGVTGENTTTTSSGETLESVQEAAACGLRTDAGWGCMLRSAQMMLAQTIRVHFTDNENDLTNIRRRRRDPLEEIRIATWFADFPNPQLALDNNGSDSYDNTRPTKQTDAALSDDHHWYSLHQMVAAGLGLGVLPGEWYGPTTACHVLRELNELHCSYLNKRQVDKKPMFRIHVATEGCIYLDAISNLMTGRESKPKNEPLSVDDPLRIPPPAIAEKQEWDTSLLLLLPLRLGIHSIPTEKYGAPLSKLMQFTQSVGMLGGTPRHALWFYGAEDVPLSTPNGEKVGGWYGLDPHTTQPAPEGELEPIVDSNTKRYRWRVHLNESYLRSLHTGPASHFNHEKALPLSKLDPTLALGFYFSNHEDFCSFQQSLQMLNAECEKNKLPNIVTVLENSPNYEVDVGEVMKNMALNGKNVKDDDLDAFSMRSEGDVEEDDDDDDDDEYVLV